MNRVIENINFKKVVRIYLILLIITIIGMCFFLGNKYFNKLEFIYNYYKINELFDKKYDIKTIEKNLSDFVNKEEEVIDAVIINNGNIVYTVNDKYKNDLTKIEGSKRYYEDTSGNIYKLSKKDDLFLSLFLQEEDKDYDDEFQLNKKYDNKYLVTYLKNNQDLIVIVSQIKPIANSELYLKISLSILLMFFMLYWIITVLMIYQNALKLKLNRYLWGILVLFTNIFGVIIYLIYKLTRITCSKCNMSNNNSNLYCPNCGNKINECCKKCHSIINKNDKYCKSCGEKL